MKKYTMVCLLSLLVGVGCAEAPLTGPDVITRSMAYHDPEGLWPTLNETLILAEIRPDGTERDVHVTLDVPSAGFIYQLETDTHAIMKQVVGDVCSATLNGSADFTEEDAQRFRLGCDQIKRMRGYYHYLYGLPMKLHDAGTQIGETVENTTFQGQDVLGVRVTYTADVGEDIWYFYFEPTTYRLVGYRFYHDESANDGEYITLEDEYELGTLRIPQTRKWYMNVDDRFLGTDQLNAHQTP